MSFIDKMQDTLDDEFNVAVTENGALGYKRSGKALLDISYNVAALRCENELTIIKRFSAALLEDKLNTMKWLFLAADVREGQGERRIFRTVLQFLARTEPKLVEAILPLIPEYTRWDNVVALIGTDVEKAALDMIALQLAEDVMNEDEEGSISLLAKWLPSNNASSARTRALARRVREHLGMTNADYRKTLARLRKRLDVIEVKMSRGEWDKIEYSAVPSRANLLYRGAFLRNDEERRRDFLSKLEKGETKINSAVLYPHEIVTNYFNKQREYMLNEKDDALEQLWRALPDYVAGSSGTLAVADGSGSMYISLGRTNTRAIHVAFALAIYFAERCSGEFKNKYISFSDEPELVDLGVVDTLRERIALALVHDEVGSTNIEAVFDLILTTAVKHGMSQEELPKNLLILSDMEFNSCVKTNDCMPSAARAALPRLFEVISARFEDAGYKLPRVIFWNIASRSGTIPLKENELGVALVSGFSPSILKMVLSGNLDPYHCLLEQINVERYKPVEDALRAAGIVK